MGRLLARAAAAFAATNLDDILLLCLLFGRAKTAKDKGKIALGQVLGLLTLTLVSLLGGLGLGALPKGALRLLGLVPVALAARMLLWQDREQGSALPMSVLGVAGLAVANGGDNLGVYLPLFAQMTVGECLLTAALFTALSGLWCLLGASLARLPLLEEFLRRWGDKLVPVVFLLLGISILLG